MVPRLINDAVDFYRTAFFGETQFLFCSYVTIKHHQVIFEQLQNGEMGGYIGATLLLANIVSGIGLTRLQFKKRSNLEKRVRENGYKDEYFRLYLRTPCDYQTAKVAAKNTGHLDDFMRL